MYIMNRTKDKLINTNTSKVIKIERRRVNGKDVYRVVVDYGNEEDAKDALCEIAATIADGTKMLEMV